MDARALPRKFVLEFLDIYRSQECLWKVKSKDYHDKFKRQEAYNILAEKLRQMDPDITRETIARKIDSFRSCFRKEMRKVKLSKASGGPVYKPRLWYFDHLTFLVDQDQPDKPTTEQQLLDEPMDHDENSLDTGSLSSASAEGTPFGAVYDPVEDPPASTASLQQPSQPRPTSPPTIRQVIFKPKPPPEPPRRKQTKEKQRHEDPLKTRAPEYADEEDEFDIMGMNIGNKLRKLPPDRVLIVEKLITDLIFEAQTGNITQSTRFNLFDLRNSSVSF